MSSDTFKSTKQSALELASETKEQCGCGGGASTMRASGHECLRALMGAALALPGLAAHAADPSYRSEDITLSFTHADYRESDDRMKIRADYLTLTLPVAERYELSITGVRDVTAGASPTNYARDVNGEDFMILKIGASIRDVRYVKKGVVKYYGDNFNTAVTLSNSKEDDYESDYVNFDYSRSFNDKLTTVSFSAGYSDDLAWNESHRYAILDEPRFNRDRSKRDISIGISHIPDKNTVWQFYLSNALSRGDLSDPYKKIYVHDENELAFLPADLVLGLTGLFPVLDAYGFGTLAKNLPPAFYNLFEGLICDEVNSAPQFFQCLQGLEPDKRPDERDVWMHTIRYSRYINRWPSALHIDYRFGSDQWGSDSHTLEIKWNKVLDNGWMIGPGIRYYTQKSADFYRLIYETAPEPGSAYTSDYRLAGFGAISLKFEIRGNLTDKTSVQLNYEHYQRKKDYEATDSFGSDIDDYTSEMTSVTLETKF